jgi:translation initiation factor IF-3
VSIHDYRVNHRIRVPEIRLIDEDGEQAGVVNTNDAKQRAQAAGLDLVEVSPHARPPVCKIMDFGKFKYDQRKKDKKGGAKHTSTMKELRVRPAIDPHDLSYRLTNGEKFLQQGHKVQVVCIFRGRQLAHPEHGFNVMKTVAEALKGLGKVESPAKMVGRRMTMLLSPLPPERRRRFLKEKEEKRLAEEAARETGQTLEE